MQAALGRGTVALGLPDEKQPDTSVSGVSGGGGGGAGAAGEGREERRQKGKISITGAPVWKFGTPTNPPTKASFQSSVFEFRSLGGERQTFLNSQRNFSCRQVA